MLKGNISHEEEDFQIKMGTFYLTTYKDLMEICNKM